MKILFVCTGNTCRSCMAEAIFNKTSDNEDFIALSAGIYADVNSKISVNSAKLIKSNLEFDITNRCAVQINPQLMEQSDLVLTMTMAHKKILTSEYPQFTYKIYTLNEYVGVDGDIIDPYGGDVGVYEKTFKSLSNSIKLLLDKLKEGRSI